MKIINKMIRKTIVEIALVISSLFISIPIWESFDLEEYETTAMYYDNINYSLLEVSDYSDYILYQVADEIAIQNLKPINIKLSNDTYTKEDYNIYLVINKTSTLDYKSLKIRYNNNTQLLKNYEMIENEEAYYFLLSKGTIKANTYESNLFLWIDSDSKAEINGKNLTFNIENIPGQAL